MNPHFDDLKFLSLNSHTILTRFTFVKRLRFNADCLTPPVNDPAPPSLGVKGP